MLGLYAATAARCARSYSLFLQTGEGGRRIRLFVVPQRVEERGGKISSPVGIFWCVNTNEKGFGRWKSLYPSIIGGGGRVEERRVLLAEFGVSGNTLRRRKTSKMSMPEGGGEVADSVRVGSDSGGGGGSLLQSGAGAKAAGEGDAMIVDQGFTRSEMYSEPLIGSVAHYERHVFLCYKNPESWPARVEAANFDRLPRYLVAALRARKNDMPRKTKLTICEGRDGTDSSSGDVLIFPEMVRYRGLTHFDVDSFVEDVLVRGKDWAGSSKAEHLPGSYVFVCAHTSRDARCGACGPVLIQKFQEEIGARQLEGQIFVRPCSHIGGHKYAGNVIIFSRSGLGQVSGHWYGYVVPEDVAVLLDQHIGQGKIIERLWRGQMGLVEEDQKILQEQRLRCQKEGVNGCACAEKQVEGRDGKGGFAGTCCQILGTDEAASEGVGFPDGANGEPFEEPESPRVEVTTSSKASAPEARPVGGWSCSFVKMPKWIKTWEREDTHAALAVVGVAVLVAVAVHLHRSSSSS
ncbi:hypothetical protein R1flu_020623 [Riccia fluitans]|uniref:Uncharacterized protein n=1 Tax=Riccia fluitans TaxID=41844 RepID=A0ABD1ZME1_9MARC